MTCFKSFLHPLLFMFVFMAGNVAKAQLYVGNNTNFLITANTNVVVQNAAVVGHSDIVGAGKLIVSGNQPVMLGMNGKSINNLLISNAAGATLQSNTQVTNLLEFANGKINCGAFNITLKENCSTTGMGSGKFVETPATGALIKLINNNLVNAVLPLGAGNIYRPLTANSTGITLPGQISVQCKASKPTTLPPFLSDYINTNWTINSQGINGNLRLAGNYDVTDVAGNKTFLVGYVYQNGVWSSSNEQHNATINEVSNLIPAGSSVLSAADKFNLINAKVFLQGAYTGSGLMADNLRTGTSVIPLTDPYRTAPYSSGFTHVGNNIAETISSQVLATQANTNNNIVDWVFVELRNNNSSPGNQVIQTRAALLQRDGDVVDIDGVSPLTFNRIADGAYTISIKHRNHLGLSTDPATFTPALSENASLTATIDFSTLPDANVFGPATAYATSADGRKMMYGGNANINGNVRFTGLQNDKDFILSNSLGNTSTQILSNVYHQSDLNMNKVVRFAGLANDKDFLLLNILNNSTIAVKSQSIPN